MMTGELELTHLERRVLFLLAEGRSNAVITRRLNINHGTLVKTLSSLYRKSGIHKPGESYSPMVLRTRLEEWAIFILDQGAD
jgi:DNA-binding NarL/FixJ family response regulator